LTSSINAPPLELTHTPFTTSDKTFTLFSQQDHLSNWWGPKGMDLEIKILDFEGQWWKFAGAKESAIKELFDMTPPAYYQLLNNLIDRDDALLTAPMLVKRLRRLREARTNARSL
jgi:hypothetical protein